MAQATAVQNKNVASSWGKLLCGASGKDEIFYQHVIKNLEGAGVPGIKWEFAEIGAKKKCLGGQREKYEKL